MPINQTQPALPLFAAIQLNSNNSVEENLNTVHKQLKLAAEQGADCAVLPETFAWMGSDKDANSSAEYEGSGDIQQFLSNQANDLNIWIIGGSNRLKHKNDSRYTNTTLVFDPHGKQCARYDKIHLFDAQVNDGSPYLESDTFRPGTSLGLVDMGFAKIGLTICYDLRFPALYATLAHQGADIIVVPAAFTVPTGRAHWETLLRARAIENQVYIIAPAQTGTHSHGRKTWGHSLCIDPWGEIINEKTQGVGNIYCQFNAEKLDKLRHEMPVKHHHRPEYYKIS